MALFVYITCPDLETAREIGRTLLDERLIACSNIFPDPLETNFLWKGEVSAEKEIAMVAKTMEDRFAELNKRVLELHPYETPCVIAMPIVAGNSGFLAWIEESTRPLRQA